MPVSRRGTDIRVCGFVCGSRLIPSGNPGAGHRIRPDHSDDSDLGQNRAEFPFRIFVVLVDGEVKRSFQQWLGLRPPALFKKDFAEQDPWHHPIGLLLHAELEMLHGLGAALFRHERLCQTETEKFVVGLLRHQRLKRLDSGRHALDRIDKHDHGRGVVGSAPTNGKRNDITGGGLGGVGFVQ